MKCSGWRILPLLLVCFLIFLARGTAQEAQLHDKDDQRITQDPRSASASAEWEQAALPTGDGYGSTQNEVADAVKEARALLRKVKPPTISKLARFARRPKGVLGTSMYYAKEAFFLLFMNAPDHTNLLTTSTSDQIPKLGQPLLSAVKLLQDAAAQNDSDAIYLLAEMNFYGNFSHPVNYNEAFNRYQQLAVKDGNSTAQYMLGFMYGTGLSPAVPADQAKSMLYHTFAAEQGNTRSEMTLAYRRHVGIATVRNCDEAVHWYKKVADKAIRHYRSGPPGGHSLVRDVYRIADEDGGVYGEGASVTSAGALAKQGGPTSDAYANMEDVLEYLYLQSSKGDLKAAFSLARLSYEGSRGFKRDFRLAKQFFMLVAREYWSENGKVKDAPAGTEKLASRAAGYLGRMFLRGEGMEQSFSKARIWFTRGVSNGDAISQYSLGLMHLNGLGMPQDTVKASDFFSAAADQDIAVAQTNLGMLFLDQGDVATAKKYFELAARSSHIEAWYYLAELNNQGIGGERQCGMAAGFYKIVAEKAEAIWGSLGEANDAYDDGDVPKAVLRYLMAAEQGSEAAQANVAWLLDQSRPLWSPIVWLTSLTQSVKTTANDAALALTYWTRSAKQQNFDSMVKMGDYYLSGLGTVASPENAAACYQLAAENLLSAQAMWNLGWMHENGIGIEQDFHLAKRYYDLALETNAEAYLPTKLSLFKLRWRSWWNDLTDGGIKSIKSDEPERKRRSFGEWLAEFLEADAAYYTDHYEADDWAEEHEHGLPGGADEYWEGDDELDDGLLETLLITGLVGALGWLLYYRQQQQRAAEERRRLEVAGQQNDGQGGQQQQPPPPVAGQQPDGGFFPQPGDPNFGAWVAGGVGV